MKKALIVLLLLTIAAGGLFAQLTKEITVDYVPDLFLYTTNNVQRSSTNVLTTSNFDSHEMRLNLTYVNENIKAFLRVNFDTLIRQAGAIASGTGFNATALWGAAFSDYYVDGTADNLFGGIWTASLSNMASRGKVDNFATSFNDFVGFTNMGKMDNFGILDFNGAHWDVNNLQMSVIPQYTLAKPYFALYANYAPFTVALAGSMNETTGAGDTYFNPYTGNNETASAYRKANGTLRISGEKIADLATFDVIYRLYNYDPSTYSDWDPENAEFGIGAADKWNDKQPDGAGTTFHTFGLYANLFVMDGLGLALGYSGSVEMNEDVIQELGGAVGYSGEATKTIPTKNPFYSGIDLRAKYSGVDQFTFTLNNNISFAGVTGAKDQTTNFWLTTGDLGFTAQYDDTPISVPGRINDEKASESYWALYNGLAVAYQVSDPFVVRLQVTSRYVAASHSDTIEEVVPGTALDDPMKVTYSDSTHVLGGAISGHYAFNPRFEFRFGVALYSMNSTTTRSVTKWYNHADKPTLEKTDKNGDFAFGIPVGILLKF